MRRDRSTKRWRALVAKFETAGLSQAKFASQARVGLPAFRYWLYKVRREEASTAAPSVPRLLPVELLAPAVTLSEPSIEVDVATLRLRLVGAADPEYVASLVGALRGA